MSKPNTVDIISERVNDLLTSQIQEHVKDEEIKNAISHAVRVIVEGADPTRIKEIREKYSNIHPRPDHTFYLNAGRVSSFSKNSLELSVRTRGLETGTVSIQKNGARIFKAKVFNQVPIGSDLFNKMKKINENNITGSRKIRYEWRDNIVREYLETIFRARTQAGGVLNRLQPEHYIESILIEQMRAPNQRQNKSPFAGRRVLGYPAMKQEVIPIQFPIPVVGSESNLRVPRGNSLGHIDVLASKRGVIEIIELKRPNKGRVRILDQLEVFRQAITYATAFKLMFEEIPSFQDAIRRICHPVAPIPQFMATICIDHNSEHNGYGKAVDAMKQLNRSNESGIGLSVMSFDYSKDSFTIIET